MSLQKIVAWTDNYSISVKPMAFKSTSNHCFNLLYLGRPRALRDAESQLCFCLVAAGNDRLSDMLGSLLRQQSSLGLVQRS